MKRPLLRFDDPKQTDCFRPDPAVRQSRREWQLWVMTDNTHIEHNESAFGLIAIKKSCDKGY
jgi:hypothetical protein